MTSLGAKKHHFFTFWAKVRIKLTLAPSFFKIEQNKCHHRVPRKKIHNPGWFKISPISYIAAVMSKNVFRAAVASARKHGFGAKIGLHWTRNDFKQSREMYFSRRICEYHLFGRICYNTEVMADFPIFRAIENPPKHAKI